SPALPRRSPTEAGEGERAGERGPYARNLRSSTAVESRGEGEPSPLPTPHSLPCQSGATAGALRTSQSPLPTPHSALRIGLSTHSPAQATRALAAEPDYLAIGPVYATGTKPTAKP